MPGGVNSYVPIVAYSSLISYMSRCQLLEVSRGLEYLHSMGVVHKNVKAVRSFLHLFNHTLTFSQTNILVDARGRAHLGGLGVALLPSDTPGVDIDRSFHGAAPELAGHGRSGLASAEATKASDVYAFGVLAWEVSVEDMARSQ